MRLGALFSGGKDSAYAIYKAMKEHKIACLISIKSINPESYMFHIPAMDTIEAQAKALGIPLVLVETKGEKEKELKDLKKAIKIAKDKYRIEGVITGAVASVYQASRVQKICDELDLWQFNPLWQKDQEELLRDLVKDRFEAVITGIAAYPFDASWLGRKINKETITELVKHRNFFNINVAGEGGEYESLVLNSPIHKRRLKMKIIKKLYEKHHGILQVELK